MNAEISTARLRLVALRPEWLPVVLDGARLAQELRVRVPASWPPEHWEPHVVAFMVAQYAAHPETVGWHRFVVLTEGEATLVGAIGGHPKGDGVVEIGYSILPEFQRRGFATEGVRAQVEWLLQQRCVRCVIAETYPHLPESIKVMERCGMTHVGMGEEEGTVRYARES
jgi:[ribosomal protein S5]-alanine N-acetyltransferase